MQALRRLTKRTGLHLAVIFKTMQDWLARAQSLLTARHTPKNLGSASVIEVPTARRRMTFTRRCFAGAGVLLTLVVLAIGAIMLRVSIGPLEIEALGSKISDALDERFNHVYDFSLGKVVIVKGEDGPALSVDSLLVNNSGGQKILEAPRAEITLDPLRLIFGDVAPKKLNVFNLDLRLSVLPDGELSLSTGKAGTQVLHVTPPPALPANASGGTPADTGAGAAKVAVAALTALLDMISGPDSPIVALDRVGIVQATLVVDDRTANQTTIFNGLDLTFDKKDGAAHIKIGADGPNGRLLAEAVAKGSPNGPRSIHASIQNVSVDEVALFAGIRNPAVDFDMPLSASVDIALKPDGQPDSASLEFGLGAGYLRLDDPEFAPVFTQGLTGRIKWLPERNQFALEPMRINADGLNAVLSGTMVPPVTANDPWSVSFETAPGTTLAAEHKGDAPFVIDRASLKGRFFTQPSADKAVATPRFLIDRAEITGPGTGVAISGELSGTGPTTRIKLGISAARMPVLNLLRLWPFWIAPPVRDYFSKNVLGGIIEMGRLSIDHDAPSLAMMREDIPPPDGNILGEFVFSNGVLTVLPGVPPLTGIDVTARVTGRTAAVSMSHGSVETAPGHRLAVSDMTFNIADGALKPTPAQVTAKISGPVESVVELLALDALKAFAPLAIQPGTVRGQIDGRMVVDLKLARPALPEETVLRINAVASGFSADRLIGTQKLEGATLTIATDKAGVKASGQGKIAGIPVQLDFKKVNPNPAEVLLTGIADDAARSRIGLNFGKGVTGSAAFRVSAVLGNPEKKDAQVELDLTKAAIDFPALGLSKPVSLPSKMSFSVLNDEDGTNLDNIAYEGNGASIKGEAVIAANGIISSASLSQVRLSPGDDMKVEVDGTAEIMKISVKGNNIDARPFLKNLFTPPADASATRDNSAKEIQVDVKSAILTGYNRQAISAFDLKLRKASSQISQFALSGRFGRDSLAGSLTQKGAAPLISIQTNDAGSLMSFIDFYKRMEGGKLSLNIGMSEGGSEGVVNISNFTVRDEPALKQLVSEGANLRDDRTGTIPQINPGAVAFTKLQAQFRRTGGRLEIPDSFVWGPQVGTNLKGWIDYGANKIDIGGTFVPSYAVNNLFTQIPVFGSVLAGGAHEGLFAINYRVSGAASAPVLSFNPLSAIAPGFLRKMFGAAGGPNGTALPPIGDDPSGALLNRNGQ